MSVLYTCDGCGAKAEGDTSRNPMGEYGQWFSTEQKGKERHACSRMCIKTVSKRFDLHSMVNPVS